MTLRRLVRIVQVLAVLAVMVPVACDDPQETNVAGRITIVSGDGQFSKKGTRLDEPFTVLVRNDDGSPGDGFTVEFRIISGGGRLSATADVTDIDGIAKSRLTLPQATGTVRVAASVKGSAGLSVVFQATSDEFFCPEENPAFTRHFSPAGNVFLFTRHSSLHRNNGAQAAGVLRMIPNFSAQNPTAITSNVITFSEQTFRVTPRDCAVSRNGAFYVASAEIDDEVVRVEGGGVTSHLSFLDDPFGYEVTGSPGAILMGCDGFGPFAVGCRDTLLRFSAAQYSGVGSDACNNSACAADPNTGDLYYIYLGDNTLRRLPLDTLAVVGPVQTVLSLTIDEANGANGMVVNDDDGSVFIIVDTDTTRQLVRVSTSGQRTVEFDFMSRGPGNQAGRQSDLAIDTRGGGVLYTIDTLNNMLLAWDITQRTLTELPPDQAAGPDAISSPLNSGERVGLVVLP